MSGGETREWTSSDVISIYFDLFENQKISMVILDQKLHVCTDGDFTAEDIENLFNAFLQEFLFLGLKRENSEGANRCPRQTSRLTSLLILSLCSWCRVCLSLGAVDSSTDVRLASSWLVSIASFSAALQERLIEQDSTKTSTYPCCSSFVSCCWSRIIGIGAWTRRASWILFKNCWVALSYKSKPIW